MCCTGFEGLNILVNNAGVQRDIDFTKGIDDFLAGENEIRVNLEAAILLTGLFVPLLAKNQNSAIVNVSSGRMWKLPACDSSLGFCCATSYPKWFPGSAISTVVFC